MNTKEIQAHVDIFDAQIATIAEEKITLIKATARARIDELIKIHDAAETGWDKTLSTLLEKSLVMRDHNKDALLKFLNKHFIPYKVSSKKFSGGDEYDGYWGYTEYTISLDI